MPSEMYFYVAVKNGNLEAVRLCGEPRDPDRPDAPGGRCVRPYGHYGGHRTQEDYRRIDGTRKGGQDAP